MGKALIIVFGVALAIYAFFDVVATPKQQVRGLPKPLWLVIVVLLAFVGPILWIALGTRRAQPPRRSGPWRPNGPDDDPDYLRRL